MNNKIIAKIQKSFERIKLSSLFSPPLLLVESKIRLNARILRLKILSALAKGA